jgi:dTMP kinase
MAFTGRKCPPGLILRVVPFITFEGVEGCGKSTQLALLAERLRKAGHRVTATREPGGTPAGEKIRGILLDGAHAGLDPVAEWLLIEAARREHLRAVIRPALSGGDFLLCDRFSDSTEAYQAAGRGIDARWIAEVDARVREGVTPDLTLLYDCDPKDGLARARARNARADGAAAEGRFEAEDLSLHEKVRETFLSIARREPRRVAVLAVDGDAAAVFDRTWALVAERFGLVSEPS